MDQDFYFEESNPKTSLFISLGIILIIVVCVFFMIQLKGKHTLNIRKNIEFEVGSKVSYDLKDYIKNEVVDESDYSLFLTGLPIEDDILSRTGTYKFTVKYKNVTKKGKLEIVDNTPPKVELNDLTIGVDEKFEGDDFLSLCDDYSKPCNVELKNISDLDKSKKAGTYSIDLIISDDAGNKVNKTGKLIVKKGYNSSKNKETDLKIHHTDPEFSDFKDQLIIKYNKGYDPNEIDDSEAYHELMEITGSDFHSYIDPLYENNLIVDSQIIEVYNKYDLIIGYAIRIKLDNGLYLYLTK